MSLRPNNRSRTSVSGSLTGSLVSRSPLTALKSAVLAPIPSASDRTTTAVHPLACSSMRTAWRRSLSMIPPENGAAQLEVATATGANQETSRLRRYSTACDEER